MLSSVFLVGRAGEMDGDYRCVYVYKLPEPDVYTTSLADNFDRIKVRSWSGLNDTLERVKDGTTVIVKGRLQISKDNELFVVSELCLQV